MDGFGERFGRSNLYAQREETAGGAGLEQRITDISVVNKYFTETGKILELGKNGLIFARGESAESVFQVVSGCVLLQQESPKGKAVTASIALPGDVIGLEFKETYPWSAISVGTSGSVVIRSAPRKYLEQAARDERMNVELGNNLKKQLRRIQELGAVKSKSETKMKVASFILWLQRNSQKNPGDGRLYFPFSSVQISEVLGVSREAVSRAMNELKRSDRLIDHESINKDTTFQILDFKKLKEVADE